VADRRVSGGDGRCVALLQLYGKAVVSVGVQRGGGTMESEVEAVVATWRRWLKTERSKRRKMWPICSSIIHVTELRRTVPHVPLPRMFVS
jgi:hypothetical protein